GKTIGKANTPSSNNRSLNRFAMAESPSMTGVIGVALRPMSNPIETSRFLKYFVFDHSFFTCLGSVSRTSIAAVQAAATAGGWEPLSNHVLDLFKAKFLRSFDPATYPPTTPRAFENVPSSTWILSSTWKWDGTPRRPSPRTPSPCASSMYTMAPNAALRFAIWSTGAMSPSIENTPAVRLHLAMVREVPVVGRANHDHALAVHHAARRGWTLEDAEFPIEALRDEVFVLQSHPGRRVAGGHRQPSMGKATFPQSPLRITSIASAYLSRGNLCVRIGRRFR